MGHQLSPSWTTTQDWHSYQVGLKTENLIHFNKCSSIKNHTKNKNCLKFPDFSSILCKILWLFQYVQNSLTFSWLENALPFFQVFQSKLEPCIHVYVCIINNCGLPRQHSNLTLNKVYRPMLKDSHTMPTTTITMTTKKKESVITLSSAELNRSLLLQLFFEIKMSYLPL